MQGPHITEPEKQPVDPSLREKRPERVSKFCFSLWIIAFLSTGCGLVVPLVRFLISSGTLQWDFFGTFFVAIGLLLTIAGIGLWHLKRWGVILCTLTPTILVSAFWLSLVDALLNGRIVKILSNGVLALLFSIGLVLITIRLWRDVEAY